MFFRAVSAAIVVGLVACSVEQPPILDVGLRLLAEGEVEEAQQYFDSLALSHPANADARAWSSHASFEIRQFDLAVARAREALVLEPCHGVAHRVIGASFNPQYQWERADDDLSWQHLSAARRCDPDDAFTWIESIVPAMRHGQSDIADQVVARLLKTGAFPPAAIAFGRWMLHDVPDNAVLVTMGDLDTFPVWGIQLAEGVRPDVAVVNVNLLSAWWYATFVRDRFDLPLPATDRASHTIESTLQAWRRMWTEGTLDRPLVFAVTVPRDLIADGPGRLQLEGAHRSIRFSTSPSPIDSARRAARSLARLDGAEFAALPVSQRLAPYATASGAPHTRLVLGLALRHGRTLVEEGYLDEARQLTRWAERFWREAGLSADQIDDVVSLRALVD